MTLAAAMTALLPAGLALLMFTVGLRLPVRDLATTFHRPRALLVGLAVQIVALPCMAFFLGSVFRLSPEMTTGLVLVAAAPGGVTSNYISLLVGADIALSATMTLCTTLACSFTIPIVLMLSDTGLSLGFSALARISLGMAGVALMPLLMGLVLNYRLPAWSERLHRSLDPIARLVFFAIVAATIARHWPEISTNIRSVGLACFALNILAIIAGFAAGSLAGLPEDKRRSIIVEASLQNVAVTIFVANSVLLAPMLAVPGLVYVFAMNISALAHIGLVSLRKERDTAAS